MRLGTIWTMPGLPLRERLSRTGEWSWMTLAHRLPRRLAYWSFVDSGARYIRSDEVVPETLYFTILNRMDLHEQR